jgi:hypothetical protein
VAGLVGAVSEIIVAVHRLLSVLGTQYLVLSTRMRDVCVNKKARRPLGRRASKIPGDDLLSHQQALPSAPDA